MKLVTRLILVSVVLFSILSLAEPGDLDIPAAQAKYDAAKAVADRARAKMGEKEREYRRAEGEYYDAVAREKRAQEDLDQAENKLVQLNNLISDLERDLIRIRSEINDLEREKDRAESTLRDLERKEHDLEHRLHEAEGDLRDAESHLATEKAKPQPDPTVVQQLEYRVQELSREVQNIRNEISNVQQAIRECENGIARLADAIREGERRYQDTQNRLYQANRDRQEQLLVISNCRDELRRAEDAVRYAESRMENAESAYQFAKSEWEHENAIAERAYAYLQQVIDNYNRERERVIRLATNAGQSHGGREAADRAPVPGNVDGQARANAVGLEVGTSEAKQRDFARGYREGREKGATLASVAAQYGAGRASGAAIAVVKATKEVFPKGYNDALSALLGAPPASETVVDISEQIPGDAGGSGPELSPSPKAVGSHPEPQFAVLQDPDYQLPEPGAISPSIPARDNRYFAPPCEGMALPEFDVLCRRVYDDSYAAGYTTNYQSVYAQAFRVAYNANIKAAYDLALAKVFPDSNEAGLKKGAEELGVLDGFKNRLPTAIQEQYAAGKEALSQLLETGHMPITRASELTEANRDGLYTPGETVKLRLVVDNYGRQASPAKKLKARITTVSGLVGLSANVRELPALAGSTRTTLEGVITAKVGELLAGQKMKLEGVIEGGGIALPFTLEKETHFPLELQAIQLAKKPKIDEKVAATFRYKNLTGERTPETKLKLVTRPEVAAVEGTGLLVPALDPGQTVDVAATVKPGMWVGQNTYVRFFSTLEKIAGLDTLTQPFHQFLELDRDGVILLYNDQGKEVPSSTMKVKAGGRIAIQALFKYLRTFNLPGPFIMKATGKSDPSISHSDGSTVSVNYGSFGPDFQPSKVRFSYDIPKALAGKTGWVMITMYNGAKVLHAMQVYLEIE